MPAVLKPRRTLTQGKVPTTSDIKDGEMAINITDQKIYVREGSNIVNVADVSSGGQSIDEGTAIAFAIALGG